MAARLLILFLLIPIIELALLLQIGRWVGFWPTIGLIVVTAFAGSYLMRREGGAAWRAFQRRLASGELPGRELIDGVLILLSGALLITPGLLTDIVGLLGLLPSTRALLRRYVLHRLQRTLTAQFYIRHYTTSNPPKWSGKARRHPRYVDQEGETS
jgi:UPF0716 protein FxsA